MLAKSQLTDIFAKYGFRPLKRLGENYLIDSNIKDKIIRAAELSKDDIVLEIGPGFGALTIDLARSGLPVYAVEIDRKAYFILKEMLDGDFPNLEIFNEDILKFDFKKISVGKNKKIKVMGNLPYYITTPIIQRLIENKAIINAIVMTVQKEMAARLSAHPGTKDYGSISCFAQYHTKPRYIHTIKRTCFYPSPAVSSSLLKLEVLREPSVSVKDEDLFFRIIRGAFNQRRKFIINSLSRQAVLDLPKNILSDILGNIGIDPASRPEDLSLSDFAEISNKISGTFHK